MSAKQINKCIAQKNEILRLVNDQRISRAVCLLMNVRERWEKLGYGYKVRELWGRIHATENAD